MKFEEVLSRVCTVIMDKSNAQVGVDTRCYEKNCEKIYRDHNRKGENYLTSAIEINGKREHMVPRKKMT